MKHINKITDRIPTSWMDNKVIITVLAMLLAIYSALAAPALPAGVIRFFDQWYGKLIFLFLIAFLSVKNIQVALMVAVVFLIILHYAAQLDIQEHFAGSCGKRENFAGSCGKREEFTDGQVSSDVVDALQRAGVPVDESNEKKEEKTSNPSDLLKSSMDSLKQLGELQGQAKSEVAEIQKSLNQEKSTEPPKATASAPIQPPQNPQEGLKALEQMISQMNGASTEKFEGKMNNAGLLEVSPYDDSEGDGAPFDM